MIDWFQISILKNIKVLLMKKNLSVPSTMDSYFSANRWPLDIITFLIHGFGNPVMNRNCYCIKPSFTLLILCYDHRANFHGYCISSYKTLPQIIPAILIILCCRNLVFSNKPRIWRLCKIIIPTGLIWANTECITI